jgi:predicted nuclease of predicted toxin-antitoxin system
MKLLLDANISWRTIKLVENAFIGCLHAKDIINIKQPAKDIEIWEYARKNNFTILTHDDDFEKLLLSKGAPPKVIILKTFNKNTKQIAEILISKKEIIESFILNNELMILEIY